MIVIFSILIIIVIILFIKKENFIDKCIDKRDGVSGCRDCCSLTYPNNYNFCVNKCMLF